MKTETLARDTTPDGKELVLYRRSGVYSLRVDGLELMSSRAHGSERALARLACEGLQNENARVLVGGLGFGYTLRSTLDHLPLSAQVVICEVFASLFEWNRSFLADLAKAPLEDSRVETLRADVWDALEHARRYDAIILDVDNGPWALTLQSNQRLYRNDGLSRIAASLNESGRLAIWSSEDAPGFESELRRAGFEIQIEHVPVHGNRELNHTLFVGVRR